MAVLRRVHDDGRPAMSFVPVEMDDIRLGMMIRAAPRIGARGHRKSGRTTQHYDGHKTHSWMPVIVYSSEHGHYHLTYHPL